jgi:uncharacterized delta-60 repeat protein
MNTHAHRLFAAVTLAVVATSTSRGGQGAADVRGVAAPPRNAGMLVQGRDGNLFLGTGARLPQQPGVFDKVGSLLLGLGYGAPAFDSAGLSVMRFTSQGTLDARFGTGGSVTTPLLPLRNRNRANVRSVLQDSSERLIVVGSRDLWTSMDPSVYVIAAARYTAAGALDTSFGDGGVVTTRVDQNGVTQAFAAALDAEGRLLVAGYSGGTKVRDPRGSVDDWSVRTVLLRYASGGVLDASFGERGVASQALDPSGQDRQSGRDFLRYDATHRKTAALVLDRVGRAVVAASNGEGPALLMRYTKDGRLDPTFGSAGMVRTSVGPGFNISTLLWDAEGRLLAVGTSADRMVLVRYSADGVPDSAFGASGTSSTPMIAGMRVSAALPERDGHLLVVASGENGVLLARVDREGMPDTNFGSDGVIHTARKWISTFAGLAVDDAGIPTVAALSSDGIFMMRYSRQGPVDLSFRSTTTDRP